jgi:arginine decarboxylase
MMQHHAAPLYDSIRAFVGRDQAPFYSPGHKGGRTLDPWFRENIAALDLNNLPDTDTLHCPTGPILHAERLIAEAWGAGESFMLVQGSTGGNIAMALATLKPGDTVLVQRNAHKSVIAGLVQCGAIPIWLQPRFDPEFGVAHGLGVGQVEDALRQYRPRALWVLHPTYYGTVADVGALAEKCRAHGVLLLVDGAHSPHFAFHPDLPVPAEHVGAAAVVQSVHKIISGLSQAAILHIDPARVDPGAVRRALQLIQTTSPHFAIMASIDLARRQMACQGKEMLEVALSLARDARARLSAIPGLCVLGPGHAGYDGCHRIDETKILVGTAGLELDGREAVRILNEVHGVQPELGGQDHVLCILTIGNTQRDVDRLINGFEDVARRFGERRRTSQRGDVIHQALSVLPQVEMTPRDAFFAPADTIPFADAPGRIVAEVVTPYPPGIPVLMPGERMTPELADLIAQLHGAGTPVSATDPTLKTIKVIK